MLTYCLIKSGFSTLSHLPAGVSQWPVALGGELVEPEAMTTPEACARYDVIHIVCHRHTYDLIDQVRSRLGRHSRTKLVLSIPSIFAEQPQAVEHGALLEACAQADLLFAGDYPTAQHVQGIAGKPVHVLTHPADIGKPGMIERSAEKIAFVLKRERLDELNREFMLFAPTGRPSLQACQVELICEEFGSDPDFLARLAQFAFICFDADLRGHDAELIYLASRGCVLIGGGRAEVNKRCFSLSAHLTFKETLKTLDWLLCDMDAKNYMLECAADKLAYYNHENSKNRLLNLLGSTGLQASRPELSSRSAARDTAGQVVYLDAIPHVSGPTDLAYGEDEFVVTCLVQNGVEYLPSFLRHYRAMGARHFYFIDNESSDDTRAILSKQPDVTLYRTALVFKKFESEIRRVIIERHCRARWCISVDIDELFEFPGLGTIDMSEFIAYLNENRYTAVIAYMVDMFAVRQSSDSVYLEDAYTHFDLSDVSKGDYFAGFEAFCDYNVLPCPEIGNYYGGVRQNYVQSSESKFLLTKHAMMFIDHHLEAATMPHFCNNARVADVTCLLKHYKLTASLKERIEEGIKAGIFSFIIKDQIAAYLSLIGSGDSYTMRPTSTPYTDIDHFVDNGFLHVSDSYRERLARAGAPSAISARGSNSGHGLRVS